MWTYNNTRITVTGMKDGTEQILALLQPVQGKTVVQAFGSTEPNVVLSILVVGDTAKNELRALLDDGTYYTLSGYGQVYGDFYPRKLDLEWLPISKQTFRPDLDETEKVYRGTLELIHHT